MYLVNLDCFSTKIKEINVTTKIRKAKNGGKTNETVKILLSLSIKKVINKYSKLSNVNVNNNFLII